MYGNNFGMQNMNYQNPQITNLEPPKQERLKVQLTKEER